MVFSSFQFFTGSGFQRQRIVAFIVCGLMVGGLGLLWPAPARALKAAEGGPGVLLLNSYHPQYPWTGHAVQGSIKGHRETVAEGDLQIEFMDLRRPAGDSGIQELLYDPFASRLQRFGISLADLPARSRVIGRPETFYQIGKAYIWIGAAVILALLCSLAIMVSNILLRIQAEKELAYREAFEGLIARISTRFVEQPLQQIDAGIDFALEGLGRFASVDRCYLILFSEDGHSMTNTHEWCAEGVNSKKNSIQSLPATQVPWFMAQIKQRQVVYVPQVNSLPETA
jgi:hypothetical protein